MLDILGIIAPVFLVIFLGLGLGKTRLFGRGDARILINFIWYVGVPALIFHSLAGRPLPGGEALKLVGAFYLALYANYALTMAVTRLLFGIDRREQAIAALSANFAAGIFIGVPILDAVYGEEGVRLLLILLSFHSLSMMPLTSILLETSRAPSGAASGEIGATEGSALRRVAKSVVTNPVMLALAVSTLWSASGYGVPGPIARLADILGGAAAPVGLFAAGMSLSRVKIAGDMPQALTTTAMKLITLPVFVFVLSHYVFTLPSVWTGTAMILASLPTGVIAYTFATQYGVAPRRAASTVLLSTFLSVAGLTLLLFALQQGWML